MAQTPDLRLYVVSAERSAVQSGVPTENACRVRVTTGAGQPRAGIEIRYRIARGDAAFPGGARSVSVATDNAGYASVSVVVQTRGAAVVVAELDEHHAEAFDFYTEGTTHRLSVYAPGSIDAAGGKIAVAVTAIDHRGDPVRRAPLTLSAINGRSVVTTRLRPRDAEYQGVVATRRAGTWTIVVADPATGARATAKVYVRPGSPRQLQILDTPDPRRGRPYDQALIRAAVIDRFGNRLDPRSIRCALGARSVRPHALVGTEAQFRLDARGYRKLPVTLRVAGTKIRMRKSVLCAAAWIDDPGLVLVGSRHRSAVYLAPPSGRRLREAAIRLTYDRKRMQLNGFSPNVELATEVNVKQTPRGMEIAMTWRRPPAGYPEGIPVGDIDWECLGPGTTCMTFVAVMSPPTEPWEMCKEQKQERRQDVCVNIIYNQDDRRLEGLANARQEIKDLLERIYNSDDTIDTCCPFIDFAVHLKGMSRADWVTKVLIPAGIQRRAGSGIVGDDVEAVKLGRKFGPFGTDEGVDTGCVNFYVADFAPELDINGLTSDGPRPRDPDNPDSPKAGFGVITPDRVRTDTLAHELGHALGIAADENISRDADELMNDVRSERTGTRIKRPEDCQKIWENIGHY